MKASDFSEAYHTPKRPRLMGRPDGFHNDNQSQEIRSQVAAPSFSSEFDRRNANSVPGPSKAVNTPLMKVARPPQFKISPRTPVRTTELNATSAHRLPAVPSPSRIASQSAKRKVAIASLQSTVASHQDEASSKIIHRATPTSTKPNNAATLKALLPPIPLSTHDDNPSPMKDMKSILSTRVALATDPMSEGGHAELLSIFLQDQDCLTSSTDAELMRGVHSSPEKSSRGRGPKYIRNGLADYASRVLSRSHTSFTLWQRETENALSTRLPIPDLRFQVLKILHLSEQPERSQVPHPMPFAVVLSRLKTDPGADKPTERVVLLSGTSSTPDLRVSNLRGLKEGCELNVWEPCHEVNVPIDVHGVETEDSTSTELSVALLCSRFLLTGNEPRDP